MPVASEDLQRFYLLKTANPKSRNKTMKQTEFLFNLCFYHIYWLLKTLNIKLTKFVFGRLYNLNFVKKRFAKFGINNPYDYTMTIENNPTNGFVINLSYSLFGGWLVLLIFSIINIANTLSQNKVYTFIFNTPFVAIVLFALIVSFVFLLTHFFLKRKSKHLIYFEYFSSGNKRTKIRYLAKTLAIFLFSIVFICLSVIIPLRNK